MLLNLSPMSMGRPCLNETTRSDKRGLMEYVDQINDQ